MKEEVLDLTRDEQIHAKGFKMSTKPEASGSLVDYSSMKLGVKTLEDASFLVGDLTKLNATLGTKDNVLRAIQRGDLKSMIEISNYFVKLSGIYRRLCHHMSNLYRYDWMLTPYIKGDKVDNQKVIKGFHDGLDYLDNFQIKKFLGETAYNVIVNGCYYGYIIHGDTEAYVQELPPQYCRSRWKTKQKPAVELNMKMFNDLYKDPVYRFRILSMLPKDFQRGYKLYVEGKLPPQFQGDTAGWYLLDPECAFKFSASPDDYPMFISTIPYILDLDAAQELDRKKMAQKLLKIIIQKMPLDKNGELVFDVDEAQELHNNVVRMLAKAIGIDVLTTFADVEVADLADKSTVSSIDELEKVERTVYNESGTAQNLFNTDGNIALEKSILDDEANMYNLILQFEAFLNDLIRPLNKRNKKFTFKVSILPTTIYNYKDLSKVYKEQVQLGYSKMLPQVALGQSQSMILATAKFENEILDLVSIFTPPMSSNTMNADSLKKDKDKDKESGGNKKANPAEDKKAGRTEKPDDEKSEKTIANRESMG